MLVLFFVAGVKGYMGRNLIKGLAKNEKNWVCDVNRAHKVYLQYTKVYLQYTLIIIPGNMKYT